MAAFGAAGRLAASFASSQGARASGKALAAAAGAYGAVQVLQRSCTEVVPYGAAAGKGRRRLAPRGWLAACLRVCIPKEELLVGGGRLGLQTGLACHLNPSIDCKAAPLCAPPA